MSKWHPKFYSGYGQWLQALPAGAVDYTSVDITGNVAVELPDLAELVTGLKADCADVGIILRHYWLAAHNKNAYIHGRSYKDSTKRMKYVIGAGVSRNKLRLVVGYIGTSHFQKGQKDKRRQLNWYGSPHTNLKDIIDAGLEPGDVLMWKKLPGIGGNFAGHFQTVQRINMHKLRTGEHGPPSPWSLDVLQGTMYEGERAGEIQSKRLTFELLTGKADGNGDVTYQPGQEAGTPEEKFYGAGKWR